ncbi:MAG: hypothetical protein ACE14P_00615 [Methanotrichaceae archaeon]
MKFFLHFLLSSTPKVSELSQRLEELKTRCVSDPANVPEVLSDALNSPQAIVDSLPIGL